jgi:hypothetical protein
MQGVLSLHNYGLMNQPHDSRGMWKQIAQAGGNAIRNADRGRLMRAPGDDGAEHGVGNGLRQLPSRWLWWGNYRLSSESL